MRNARELYGLKAVTMPELFGLKKLSIEYRLCHRGANKFTDNFIRVGDLYVGYWDTVGKHGGKTLG